MSRDCKENELIGEAYQKVFNEAEASVRGLGPGFGVATDKHRPSFGPKPGEADRGINIPRDEHGKIKGYASEVGGTEATGQFGDIPKGFEFGREHDFRSYDSSSRHLVGAGASSHFLKYEDYVIRIMSPPGFSQNRIGFNYLKLTDFSFGNEDSDANMKKRGYRGNAHDPNRDEFVEPGTNTLVFKRNILAHPNNGNHRELFSRNLEGEAFEEAINSAWREYVEDLPDVESPETGADTGDKQRGLFDFGDPDAPLPKRGPGALRGDYQKDEYGQSRGSFGEEY
jgi:hypothetical protein